MHLLCAGWGEVPVGYHTLLLCAYVDGARGGYEGALEPTRVRHTGMRVNVSWETGEGLAALWAGRSAAALLAGPLLTMLLSRKASTSLEFGWA